MSPMVPDARVVRATPRPVEDRLKLWVSEPGDPPHVFSALPGAIASNWKSYGRPFLLANDVVEPHTLELFYVVDDERIRMTWSLLPTVSAGIKFEHEGYLEYGDKRGVGPAAVFWKENLQVAFTEGSRMEHIPFGKGRLNTWAITDSDDFGRMDEQSCHRIRGGGFGDTALCTGCGNGLCEPGEPGSCAVDCGGN